MKRVKNLFLTVIVILFCSLFGVKNVNAATPVNSDATEEVRQVLNYLENISGNHIIAGQHDKPSYPTETYNRVYQITGCYPGIWGGDFGFMSGPNDTIYNREELVQQAIEKWNNGSIPAWTWHMVRPDKEEPNTWEESVLCYSMSDYDFQQMTTPGTSYYECFIGRIDSVVWAFQALEDAGVPVLWRPFHEMNANWFWWGGNPTYSPKLYQIMYDRYTNYWGLDNIIWVWNVDRPYNGAIEQYYPGEQYVDVLSMDIYNNDYNYSYYQSMVDLANGKPIALGEVGEIPSVNILWEQPQWTYFMCWTEYLEGNNSHSFINEIYWQDKVITCGEISLESVGSTGSQGQGVATLADGEYYFVGTNTNKVVCSDNYGNAPLVANKDSYGGDWEKLTIVNNSDGTISLKSGANGNYVCAVIDESNQLLARSSAIADWEKFNLVKVSDAEYALKAVANGKYVCVDENNGNVLYANRDSISGWETFKVYNISGVQITPDSDNSDSDSSDAGSSDSSSEGENIAYHKVVEVSSTESSEHSGSNAVDADGTTRWSSSYADEQYIIVDLGETKQISRVKLSWEAAYASQYQIQTSTDYDNWTTVHSDYNATGGTQSIEVNATARYVKVYCIRRATEYGFSLYEFEIYGNDSDVGITEGNENVKSVVNAPGEITEIKIVDANAVDTAKSLFVYLKEVGQDNLLFGHQNDNSEAIVNKDGIISDTYHTVGTYPAITGFEMANVVTDSGYYVGLVKQAYKNNSIPTLCDHMPNFSSSQSGYTSGDMTYTYDNIMPGGTDHWKFLQRLDSTAEFALSCVDENGELIPIIYRPFHENSGNWFWWGTSLTKDQFINLWRFTVEYLRDEKGVHNLLYAYSPNGHFSSESDYLSRYPGDDYVDIIGFDIYHDYPSYSDQWMQATLKDAQIAASIASQKGKVAALTEVGLRYNGSDGLAVYNNSMQDWFTRLYDTLMNDGTAKQLAYMMTWRNQDKTHFWVPYDNGYGDRHEMADNFTAFYNKSNVIFADRLGNFAELKNIKAIGSGNSGSTGSGSTNTSSVVANGEYYFVDSQGMVVCAENTGNDPLIANRSSFGGAWETLHIVNNSDGTVSLKSGANGLYVCAVIDESNQLLARSSAINTWEKFYLERVSNGSFALKAVANGKYVCADQNKSSVLYADRDSVGGWETLKIYTTGGSLVQ